MMTHMKYLQGSSHLVLFAGCVALLHVVLTVTSGSCAFAHAAAGQHHHAHHGEGSSSQNVFCDWACQATDGPTIASGPPPAGTELMLGPADLSTIQPLSSARSFSNRTRAPPMSLLISLV